MYKTEEKKGGTVVESIVSRRMSTVMRSNMYNVFDHIYFFWSETFLVSPSIINWCWVWRSIYHVVIPLKAGFGRVSISVSPVAKPHRHLWSLKISFKSDESVLLNLHRRCSTNTWMKVVVAAVLHWAPIFSSMIILQLEINFSFLFFKLEKGGM